MGFYEKRGLSLQSNKGGILDCHREQMHFQFKKKKKKNLSQIISYLRSVPSPSVLLISVDLTFVLFSGGKDQNSNDNSLLKQFLLEKKTGISDSCCQIGDGIFPSCEKGNAYLSR